MKGAVFAVAFMYATMAAAEWKVVSSKDEMRDISYVSYINTADLVRGEGVPIFMAVVDKGDGKPGAMFHAQSGRIPNCREEKTRYCNLELRFNNGDINEVQFFQDDDGSLTPTQLVSFVGTLTFADVLYIELPMANGLKAQYRFNTATLPAVVARSPKITLLGYDLGMNYRGKEPSLPKQVQPDGRNCYKGTNQKVLDGASYSEVTLCFYKGIFYSAILRPGNKAAYAEGEKYLTNIFGQEDTNSLLRKWPASSGKVVETNTRSAIHLVVNSGDLNAPFIISDDIFIPLVRTSN